MKIKVIHGKNANEPLKGFRKFKKVLYRGGNYFSQRQLPVANLKPDMDIDQKLNNHNLIYKKVLCSITLTLLE